MGVQIKLTTASAVGYGRRMTTHTNAAVCVLILSQIRHMATVSSEHSSLSQSHANCGHQIGGRGTLRVWNFTVHQSSSTMVVSAYYGGVSCED